jgi:uncharacterized protein (TIGR02611 family)
MFSKIMAGWRRLIEALPHPVRWFATMLVGFIIVIVGILMLPLPGPGSLIILLGLTILSVELEWARQTVKAGEQWLEKLVAKIKTLFLKKNS